MLIDLYWWHFQGPESKEFEAASKLEDDVDFYQTASPVVAGVFQLDTKAKRPALVLLKKEAEKRSLFGWFTSYQSLFIFRLEIHFTQ